MKKTLFLLLALPGLALAEDSQASYTPGVDSVTVNGSVVDIEALESATSNYIKDNIYYVMTAADPLPEEQQTDAYKADADYYYQLSANETRKLNSVVNIGSHGNPDGPVPTPEANSAHGYYIGVDGTLCISHDTNAAGVTVQQILTQTEGEGDIILRAPGYNQNQNEANATRWDIELSGKTQVTGDLYLSPYVRHDGGNSYKFHNGVRLFLKDGADVSSFNSVLMGYTETYIKVEGAVGADADGNHINNLRATGSGFVYLESNSADNEEIVLGGTTILEPYLFSNDPNAVNYADQGVQFHMSALVDTDFRIRHLSSGDGTNSERPTLVKFGQSAIGVDSVLNVDSFDYKGQIALVPIVANNGGSLHVNITLQNTLQNKQRLEDTQVYCYSTAYKNVSQTLTIKGSGTYVLSKGNSMDYSSASTLIYGVYNFGKLDDNWTGTVEVNDLKATGENTKIQGIKIADYGNENSTIHFKGFKGYLTDSDTEVVIKSDLIIADGEELKGYEISGGAADQKQTYTGAISGTGAFVVSANGKQAINLQGDLSGWKDGAELKVTAGEHAVTFSGDACEVNAGVSASGGALHMTVSTEKGTTFTERVDVTSLTVSGGSVANLQATTTAGNVQVDCRGDIVAAKLSNGLTIEESSVSSGAIADAKITARDNKETVELADLEASNLYLYGKDVSFHSAEDEEQFKYSEQMTYGLQTANEVVYTTDIFSGMTLAKDGAKLTLSVLNAVDWTGAQGADMTNVTIFLEGFTIEKLANSFGDWSWTENGLTLLAADSQVAMMSADPSATVTDLLKAQYKFVTYRQNSDGLTIRMANIPEPATATLSLLALAALAARRRRK